MKHDWQLLTETVLSNHGAAGEVIDCIKKRGYTHRYNLVLFWWR